MTTEQFLHELEAIRNKYRFVIDSGSEELRAYTHDDPELDFYPITMLYYDRTGVWFPTTQYLHAAKLLGMQSRAAERIVAAADNNDCYSLRERLIVVLAL